MDADFQKPMRDLFRARLKRATGALASIAAVGAIVGGLAGYLNAWSSLRSVLFRASTSSESAASAQGPSVLVTPFANRTGESSWQAFVDSLTRATRADLGKFGQLRVLASTVPDQGTDRARPSADYLVEGQVARNGGALRVMLWLVDTKTGAQVWSSFFDAQASSDDFLTAQEAIAGRAAAIIGSWSGQIAFNDFARIASKPLDKLSPYECIVEGVLLNQRPLPDIAVRARRCLEDLVAREPTNADAWSALAAVENTQRLSGLGLTPEEANAFEKRAYLLNEMLDAANRAATLAPGSSFAHRMLALAFYAQCDKDRLLAETRKAIELNPNDPMNYGILGTMIAYAGDVDAGAAMVEKGLAMLGPDAPRWWYGALATRYFARGEYQMAYEARLKAYYAQDWQSYLFMAAVASAAGHEETAKAEIEKMLRAQPSYNLAKADALARSSCTDPEFRTRWLGFLRKAGLPE